MGGYGSEADDESGVYGFELRFEPGTAGSNLQHVGFLMDAELASWLPLEVLDSVGYVYPGAVDAGFFKALVEELAGGTDEGAALLVFVVTGLLADHHDGDLRLYSGSVLDLAENGLGGVTVQITALTSLDSFAEGGEGSSLRDKRNGRGF